MSVEIVKYIVVAVVMLSTLGSAFGISKIAKSGLDGMSRNPEAAGNIMTAMILSIAFTEALAIYDLVVAFLLLFG